VAPPNQNVEPGVPLPDKIAAALARFREPIPVNFDSAYVDSCSEINALAPRFVRLDLAGREAYPDARRLGARSDRAS
jgi:hypothetical protein